MSDAIAYATGVALSPLPVVVALVLLSGVHSRRAGLAFLLGTTAGTAVAVGVLVAVVAALGVTDAPETVDGARVAVGTLLALVGISFAALRRRLRTVRLLDRAAAAPPPRAAAIGAVLPLVNVKNLSLMLAAAIEVVSRGSAVAGTVVVTAISLSVVAPVAAVGLAVPATSGVLRELRRRVTLREVEIGIAVCLILGLKLLVDGLA